MQQCNDNTPVSSTIATSYNGHVTKTLLRGHKDQITCLDISSLPSASSSAQDVDHCVLVSGSADGTARLWDLRINRAALCLVVPTTTTPDTSVTAADKSEITAVSLRQLENVKDKQDNKANTTNNNGATAGESTNESEHCCDKQHCLVKLLLSEYQVYIGTSTGQVLVYDLRSIKDHNKVIITTPTKDMTNIFQCQDEINQISQCSATISMPRTTTATKKTTPRKNGAIDNEISLLWTATADDHGHVRLLSELDATCTTTTTTTEEAIRALSMKDTSITHHDYSYQPQLQVFDHSEGTARKRINVDENNDNNGFNKKTTTKLISGQSGRKVALVASATFRHEHASRKRAVNRQDGAFIASGGTDCIVRLWDVNNSSLPPSSHDVSRSDTNTNQMCNPPMVHSLSWSPSGNILAAGLGDGSCFLYHVLATKDTRRTSSELKPVARLNEAHSHSVSCVHFPNTHFAECEPISKWDRLLITAGNDGNILFWDLGANIAGEMALEPSELSPCFADGIDYQLDTEVDRCRSKRQSKKKQRHKIEGNPNAGTQEPKVMFGINHSLRPNWIVSRFVSNCSADRSVASTESKSVLFVADTSNDVTMYIISA